jgi:hypothetical protein
VQPGICVKPRFKTSFLAFVFLSVLPIAALAKPDSCPSREPMLTLADRLLGELDGTDHYVAGKHGRDAAYLKLQYGKMSDPEIHSMMGRLAQQEVQGNFGFVYAYYISRYGLEGAQARLPSDIITFFEHHGYDPTLIRELAVTGQFNLILHNLTAPTWKPDADYLQVVALPFIDFPVAERKRLALAADKAGADMLAAGLYVSLPTHEGWPGVLKRGYFRTQAYDDWLGAMVAYSAVNADAPPLPFPKNRRNGAHLRKLWQKTYTASWLVPQSSLLYAFADRYWFEPIYAKRAGDRLWQAYQKGELRPDGPVDKGWLLTFRSLAEVTGDPAMIVRKMQRVFIASWHWSQASAGIILDTMLAAEAIGPWLKNETTDFPALPALASDRLKAAWPEWRALAEAIKAGRDLGPMDKAFSRRGMAAELLYAKSDYKGLLALIAAEKNPGFRQWLTSDFMARFDRLCESKLYFPGEGLFLRDSTIHQFDPPPK